MQTEDGEPGAARVAQTVPQVATQVATQAPPRSAADGHLSDRECAAIEVAIGAIRDLVVEQDADADQAVEHLAAIAVGVIRGRHLFAPAAAGGAS